MAYHWTNSNPQDIVKHGFHSDRGIGQTYSNSLGFLYDENIPFTNLLFVSDNSGEFSRDGKYCIEIDISGLEKYPDYNHLLDFGVYFNDDDGRLWINEHNMPRENDELRELFAENGGSISVDEFDGDDSMYYLNSCVVDGDLIDSTRILGIENK